MCGTTLQHQAKQDTGREMLMSLQLIYGPSGSGKSYTLYKKIIEQSMREPQREFIVIVPEQFTMQTQRELVELHPRKGIQNIDVQSFLRLAWRIFEEVGADTHTVLEDTGKNLLLRRVASRQKENLTVLGRNFRKPGYISQVKSVISELKQYDVSLEELDAQIENGKKDALYYKLKDIRNLYEGFEQELQGKYITSEEILEELCNVVRKSRILKDCVIALDGFTGFTPIQKKLLRELMQTADKIYVTMTLDAWEDPMKKVSMHKLSYLSKKTMQGLAQMAKESGCRMETPEVLGKDGCVRFRGAPALAFLERHVFRHGRQSFEAASVEELERQISLHEAKDAAAEAEFAARTIWHLVRDEKLRYREIAVITGDMESFGDHMKKVLQENDIPCFIDRTRRIVLNPMVEFLRAALQIAAKSFRYESVFRYLRTGLSPLSKDEVDRLENYVLANGIHSRRRWEEAWYDAKENTEETWEEQGKTEAQICQEMKEKILPSLLAFVDQVKEKDGCVRQKTEALYYLMESCDIEQKMQAYRERFEQEEAYDLAREYEQIYGIVIELFDKLVELLGDEPMSLQEYTEILDAGFEEAKVGMIPPTMDCVLVGDIERTRLKDIKVLFFLGLNDGWVPKKEEKTNILSDMDREELSEYGMELAPTARENSYIQKFYLYLNLTKPSQKLYLSYGRMGLDGRALRPSYVIGTICRMFPQLVVQDEDLSENPVRGMTSADSGLGYLTEGLRKAAAGNPDKSTLGLLAWYETQEDYKEKVTELMNAAFLHGSTQGMSQQTAKRLYGQTLINSVSRLEQFSACSYAHFLRYGLRVSPRERFVFQPVDMGNIFHKVLEHYARKVEQSGYDWFTIPQGEQKRLTQETVEEVSEQYASALLHSSARNEYMIKRMKRIMERTIWALTSQVRAGKFIPSNFEVPFLSSTELESVNLTLAEHGHMRLKGRIDRIDTCETEEEIYVKVIDYKSGNKVFDLQDFYYGLQLQLVVYLNAAMELEQRIHPHKKVKPAGIFYYNMKDPLLDQKEDETPEETSRRMLKELRPNGLVNGEEAIVKTMDLNLEKSSDVIPVSRNKDGSYSRYSSVASTEQLRALSGYVREKMKQIGCEILEGKAGLDPYEKNGRTACDYCDFKDICGFDRKIPGINYRRLKEFKPEEIWKMMQEDE